MRAFITDLAAYNSGSLVGAWVDPDTEDVDEAIERVLEHGAIQTCETNHEEWFVTDYDDLPNTIAEWLGEYPDSETLTRVASFDDDDLNKLCAYLDYNGSIDLDTFDPDNVIGPWGSMEDVTYEHVAEFILPEIREDMRNTVENYFDYKAFSRDLEIEGRFVTVDQVGVFEIVD